MKLDVVGRLHQTKNGVWNIRLRQKEAYLLNLIDKSDIIITIDTDKMFSSKKE